MGLGIGISSFSISITKEIQRILHSINATQANEHQSSELKVLFTEYIHVHTAVKQLSIVNFNENQTAKQVNVH